MQADGNLVVYRECDHQVIWASQSNYSDSRFKPLSLLMQSDGNLVMYDARHKLVWASGTAGDPFTASHLRLEDTGSLCIGKARGECLWKSGGMGLCRPVDASKFQNAQVILSSGKKMTLGQKRFSRNKACILTLQKNGDLHLYRQCDGVSIFSVRHGLNSPEGLGNGSNAFVSQLAIDVDGRLYVNEATQYRETLFRGIKTTTKSSSDNVMLADLRLSDDCQLCVFKEGACLWFGHAKTYPCPVILAGSVLKSGQTLSAGQSLHSPRHNVQLKMENNGNLWLRRGCDGEVAWGILLGDVLTMDIPSEVTMQADGNLALYNSKKVLVWDSGTTGKKFAGADLRFNNDGTLCIAKNGSRCLWTSGGYGLCDPLYSKTFDDAKVILKSGERLTRNSTINSKRATCSLQFQADGDVVLYRECDGATIFSFRKEVIFLRNMDFLHQFGISTHGHLEAYGLDGTVITLRNVTKRMQWDTTDGADLRLHDDCVLCIYRNGICLWISSGLSYGCHLVNSTEPAAVLFQPEHQSVAPQRMFNAPRQPAESIWSSASSFAYKNHIDNPQSVVMQENGNLAIYRLDGLLLWSSGTFSPQFAGARLRLDDTGTLCIFTDKDCLWESGGFALCQPLPSPTFEKAEVVLRPGMSLLVNGFVTKQGACQLTVRPNGNLMLSRICDDAAIFSVRHGVGFTDNLGWSQNAYVGGFSLNQFGILTRSYRNKTFMLYNFNDIRRLFNGTATGANLRLRSDCRMCLFKAGACLWTAHAFTYPCPVGTVAFPVTVGVGIGCAVIVLLIIGLLMWFYGQRQIQARRKGWMYKNNMGFANTFTLELSGLGGDNDELKAVCSEYVALLNVPMDHLEL
ncbi:hypothetical protein BV898_19522, partial [Hypsibius exemplaris]